MSTRKDKRPAPMTPPDCDLRDFSFMPLDCERLGRSKQWLIARRRPEIGFYAINLWRRSWHEVPAGSLENDDDVLADAAMCSPERWPEVKADAMRGFVLCSDDRLYHPTVTEKALEAWRAKCAQRARTKAAREAKLAKKSGPKKRAKSTRNSVTENVDAGDSSVTGSKGQGQGQYKGEGYSTPLSPPKHERRQRRQRGGSSMASIINKLD